jgi:Zn-dependent protease with chaperone function
MAIETELPRNMFMGATAAEPNWDAVYTEQLPRVYNFFRYRLGAEAVGLAATLWRGHRVSQLLRQGSQREHGVWFFESDEPNAFVLGRGIYASSALRSQPLEICDVVLAHERAHAERRDPFWRAVAVFLAALHLPHLAAALRVRLRVAQELAADVEASKSVGGGALQVARAIVRVSSSARHSTGFAPPAALAFTEGDVEVRVLALLQSPIAHRGWVSRCLLAASAVGMLAFWFGRDAVHHGLETLLGALS